MELAGAQHRLVHEPKGFSPETVAETLHDCDRWADAPIQSHVAVLAEGFALQRLRAVAQTEGSIVKEVPEVLFVCVHNAGRSQMA